VTSRNIAIALHVNRADAVEAAAEFVAALSARGITCYLRPDAIEVVRPRLEGTVDLRPYDPVDPGVIELVVVFGGDGTILRAAEWALPAQVPILGVNLGHVGFLAELEPSRVDELIERIVNRDYQVEERLCLEVVLRDSPGGDVRWSSYAINEVSMEKAARERMVEVLVEIDGKALQRWGTDGVLVSTPTGSTAYAFSAQGPVMWPDLDALLVVPLLAHALFARPLVLSPTSVVTITMLRSQSTSAVLWCDGRRSTDVHTGGVVEVRRLGRNLKIARLDSSPFVERLVRKFQLPVEGWRRIDAGKEIQAIKSEPEPEL
jgi:NAD+ kinase